VDAVVLAIKVVLVLCFTVFRDILLDSWLLIAILYMSGLTWTFLMFREMPYVHGGVNGMQAGFAAVFVWSTVALTVGCMMSHVLGFLAVYAREHYIATLPLDQCSRVVHLDIWARHRMQDYAQSRLQSGGAANMLAESHDRRGQKADATGSGAGMLTSLSNGGGGGILEGAVGSLLGLGTGSSRTGRGHRVRSSSKTGRAGRGRGVSKSRSGNTR